MSRRFASSLQDALR
uniref:Uncharacterized protein n=1 Tax=Anguilla anguilla TaxID=7936 RepID=A0A0E9UES1_ANGAN